MPSTAPLHALPSSPTPMQCGAIVDADQPALRPPFDLHLKHILLQLCVDCFAGSALMSGGQAWYTHQALGTSVLLAVHPYAFAWLTAAARAAHAAYASCLSYRQGMLLSQESANMRCALCAAGRVLKPAIGGFARNVLTSPAYERLRGCLGAFYEATHSQQGQGRAWLAASPQAEQVVNSAEQRAAAIGLPPWGMSAAQLADAEAAALLAWYPLVQTADAVVTIFATMSVVGQGMPKLAKGAYRSIIDPLESWAHGKIGIGSILPPWLPGQPVPENGKTGISEDELLEAVKLLGFTQAIERRSKARTRPAPAPAPAAAPASSEGGDDDDDDERACRSGACIAPDGDSARKPPADEDDIEEEGCVGKATVSVHLHSVGHACWWCWWCWWGGGGGGGGFFAADAGVTNVGDCTSGLNTCHSHATRGPASCLI